MKYHEIVKKLVGPICPVGETNTDNDRYENLEEMIELVDLLVGDIDRVVVHKGRPEHSLKKAGERAKKFLDDLGIVE